MSDLLFSAKMRRKTDLFSKPLIYTVTYMYVLGVVNRTLNIHPQLSELFGLSERLNFGAGQRGSDNRGWTV